MIKALDIKDAAISDPLLNAAKTVSGGHYKYSKYPFLRRSSKWLLYIKAQEDGGHRLAEVAVWFHLTDAFRSGDIWLAHSKRYADLKQVLVPAKSV